MSEDSLSLFFLGTSAFAVPSLKLLASDPRFRIDLVITQPDKPAGRGKTLTASPVKLAATALQLPLWQPEAINAEWHRRPLPLSGASQPPFYLIVISYGQILSQSILDVPTIAPVNVHASLLPRWRGASPLQHAILAGDHETGVTVQRMVKELDAGPILAKESVPIGARETTLYLHDRLAEISARLLVATLGKPLRETEQSKEGATVCKKLQKSDGVVSPLLMTAEDIDRHVRALQPWPGVTLTVDGQSLKLIETALAPARESRPLPCAGGTTLHLVTVQSPGRNPVTGADWERGRN